MTLRGFLLLEAASGAARPQQALAAQVGLDKTTMVAAVDDLVAGGLVERRPDAADRRVRLVAVTDEGERRRQQGRAVVLATEAELLEELGASGREQLQGLLLRLLSGRLGASAAGGSCV
jgi:DNA-binding MarR family transcriptional regulator